MKPNLVLVALATVLPFTNSQDISSCFGKVKNPNSKKPECGGFGTLANPDVLLDTGGIKFDDCSGRCGNLGFRCKSVFFNKTDGGCTLYRKKLDDMGFMPSTPAPKDAHFYDKNCLNITCGPYCSFAPLREPKKTSADEVISDGSFESENAPAWLGGNGGSISHECDGGFFPYDGIRFGNLVNSNDSQPYIFQFSPYKRNVQYTFSYRYRVPQYTGPNRRNFCNLTPSFSGIVVDSEVFGQKASFRNKYTAVTQVVTPTKKSDPPVIQFSLVCTLGVEAAVTIDTVSLLPV